MFFQVSLTDGCWIFGDLMCAVYGVLNYITISVSVGTIVLISVDRYVAICDPLHYPTRVTKKRVKFCVCLCWLCSPFCLSVVMKDKLNHLDKFNSCSGECVVVLNLIERIGDLIITFLIPITVIVALYVRVFMVALTQARAMRSHIAAVTVKRSKPATAKKSEVKAARTLGVLVFVFLICICPFYCVSLTGQDTLRNSSFVTFVIYLFYLNSCLNPLIYAFFYPWFRKSIKLIVTLKILQADSCRLL